MNSTQQRRLRVAVVGAGYVATHHLSALRGLDFVDLDAIDLVGIYDSYAAAEDAWRGKAQRTVDDAEMKYVVVHLHRLLEPDSAADTAAQAER